jgi:exodeoxyribonuclease VII large subunit
VISAVGHEIDFTIADFVADRRAPTPSGAAEIAVPDQQDWLRTLDSIATRIARHGRRTLEELAQTLDWLSRRLLQTSPTASLQRSLARLAGLKQRLNAAQRRAIGDVNHRLELAMRGLHSVSPLATLERGYAIVADAKSGKVLLRATDAAVGDDIRARLADGELVATVKKNAP